MHAGHYGRDHGVRDRAAALFTDRVADVVGRQFDAE
jgi:hypothetical protein